MSIVPCVLCIDVEPDRRVPSEAFPPAGFERLLSLVPRLRDRLASAGGGVARFTWAVRMDPQIEAVYGAPDWFPTTYRAEFDRLQAVGDTIGIHTHSWRRQAEQDEWVSDQADSAWIAHCVDVGLESYRAAFGRACEVYRHGDRFMSSALARQIEDAGVRVDLSLEPGLAAARGLGFGERTTGWLPDTQSAPHHAYRPSRADFLVPDPSGGGGLLMMPLTAGLAVSVRTVDDRPRPAGSYETLLLWTEPEQFARRLRTRLRQPDLSHLAFAIRSDVPLLADAWARIECNLHEIAIALPDAHRWCTALEAAGGIASDPDAPSSGATAAQLEVEGRASLWLRGAADPGYREGAEVEALAALEGAAEGDGMAVRGSSLRWVDEEAHLSCPVCGVSGVAARIAVAVAAWRKGEQTGVLRCPYCRTIVLERAPEPAVPLTDTGIEEYVEQGAGINALLATLSWVEPRPGLRLLDVGCGYGFGVDLARFAWGWDGVGVDPWNLAARGQRELDVDIRVTELTPDLELGAEPYDVILASEVIEHLPEPLLLLRDLRRRLAPDGVVVLSTPDAALVDPTNSPRDVVAVLGLGDHAFLADAEGLERLLRRAGFGAVRVCDDAGILRAMASPSAAGLARCRPNGSVDLALLTRYCDVRASMAPPNSSLQLGMAARQVQYALSAADFPGAESGYERLRDTLRGRHGVDLDDPDATRELAGSTRVPMVAAQAHYDAGLLELLERERPERAAAQFAAAAAAADTNLDGPSAAPAWLQARAMGHEALALARSDPARAPAAVHRLRATAGRLLGRSVPEIDVLCGRVFTELVAGGHYEAAEAVRPLVVLATAVREIDGEIDDVGRTVVDTSFSLGMLGFQRDRPAEAAAYFGLCARLTARIEDPSVRELGNTAREHENLALRRLTRRDGPDHRDDGVVTAAVGHHEPTGRSLVVTAVIPVYNGRRHLREAVDSVLAQTTPPDELVLIDDGSSDGGVAVLDDVSAPFPIHVIHQDHAGQSAARNRAVEHARGDAIAFLDQDDTWYPEHLATLCQALAEDPRVGWVYCDFDEIDADGRTVTRSFLREQGVRHPRTTLAACVAEDLMVIPSASVIRRRAFESVGGFDQQLSGYEDDDLYLRMFRSGWQLVFHAEALTRFRVHFGSSSANGRFADSRLRFSEKLRAAVVDDRRLNRYYFRDVIAPRFFRASLDDYVRAVSDRDWRTAVRMWADVAHFAKLRRDHSALRWKVELIRDPRRFRWMLRINDALPERLRPMKDPALRLR